MMTLSRYTLFLALFLGTCAISCKKKTEQPPGTGNNGGDTTNNSPSWKIAGKSIEANNPDAYATITVDKNGVPYLLFQDGANGFKAAVMKLDGDSAWQYLGAAGFSDGRAASPAMVFGPDGFPYVVFIENSSTASNKVNVMRFNGDQWVQMGITHFQANSICAPSIDIDQAGFPVITYIAPPYTGKVMKYDGATWNTIFTSPLGRRVYDIDIRGNYLAYLWDTAIGKTHLDIVQYKNGNWENTGFPPGIFPTSYFLATDGAGIPYIAIEGKSPARLASVMKLQSTWTNIGAPDFSAGIAAKPYITVSNDSVNTPYLSYLTANNNPVIMSFTGGWANVGTGFPKGEATHVSTAVDPIGKNPYIAVTNTDGSVTVLRHK